MPTQIVIDINDPNNTDAWGLHPVPGGAWVPGNYVKGSVASYGNSLWLALNQTSGTPGSSADWVALVSAPPSAYDPNSFIPMANLPVTRGQGRRALRANGGTGGVAWPGANNWLKIVENALGADEGDANVIAFDDAFWPIGGAVWTFIQAALAAALGSFTSTQLTSLQSYAITNR
jgi:hypothetical protein